MNSLPYTTRPLPSVLAAVLQTLKPGQRVHIHQVVRVGSTKTWPVEITGTFRHLDSLATGLATQRVPEDDILVAVLHFTKENGELSSVTLDEHSSVKVV